MRIGPAHAAQRARFRRRAQAACAAAGAAALLAAGVGAPLVAGCARAPVARSGVEARMRFLAAYGSVAAATRGAGSISLQRADRRRGGARARWAANAESVGVAGYFGPARVLDGALKGDSLYLALRHYDLGVAGPLRGEEGLGARLLRFVATPWDLSAPWLRGALERSEVESSGKGWLCRGSLVLDGSGARDSAPAAGESVPAAGESAPAVGESAPAARYRFTLELTSRGAPSRWTLRREGDDRELVSIRCGPERRFRAGRIPGWIEWSYSGSVMRLTIEDLSPIDGGKIRYAPPADSGWTMLALDEPQGRALVRWLLGLPEDGGKP